MKVCDRAFASRDKTRACRCQRADVVLSQRFLTATGAPASTLLRDNPAGALMPKWGWERKPFGQESPRNLRGLLQLKTIREQVIMRFIQLLLLSLALAATSIATPLLAPSPSVPSIIQAWRHAVGTSLPRRNRTGPPPFAGLYRRCSRLRSTRRHGPSYAHPNLGAPLRGAHLHADQKPS